MSRGQGDRGGRRRHDSCSDPDLRSGATEAQGRRGTSAVRPRSRADPPKRLFTMCKWHELEGDVSLVGPRPLLDGRPDRTGLAQVHGRNAIDWDQRFALDIKDVEHHDSRMHADIPAGTIRAVLTREGVSHSADVDRPWFTGPPAAGDREGDDR